MRRCASGGGEDGRRRGARATPAGALSAAGGARAIEGGGEEKSSSSSCCDDGRRAVGTSRKQKEAEERAIEFEKQWVAESKQRKELHNQREELVGNLRVYCRVRPASSKEQEGLLSVEVKGADRIVVKDHDDDRKENKTYNFTQVYGPGTSQEDVFKDCETLMTSVLDGFNVCIFAYGQSGTGKTFTMEGNDEHPAWCRALSRASSRTSRRASSTTSTTATCR